MKDKKKIIKKISQALKGYDENLNNRDFLFYFYKGRELKHLKIKFESRHFLHLTGLETSLSAKDFYKLLKKGHLKEEQFQLKKDGTTLLKLAVIERLPQIISSHLLIGEYNGFLKIRLVADYVLGDTKRIMTLGVKELSEKEIFIPNTLLQEDVKHISHVLNKVVLIFSNKINYKSKDFSILPLFTSEFGKEVNLIHTIGAKDFAVPDVEKIKEELGIKDYRVISGHQVHSAEVVAVREGEEGYFEHCDGFVTNSKKALIYTKYADCLPIYFYDPVKEVIGISHSGWKGTLLGIGVNTLIKMEEEFGCRREDILIGLGPSICMEHYEVSEDFLVPFKERYESLLDEKVFSKRENRWYFDNRELNRRIFMEAGIRREHIFVSTLCTYEEAHLHSYRRDREKSGRNGGFIYFRRR